MRYGRVWSAATGNTINRVSIDAGAHQELIKIVAPLLFPTRSDHKLCLQAHPISGETGSTVWFRILISRLAGFVHLDA